MVIAANTALDRVNSFVIDHTVLGEVNVIKKSLKQAEAAVAVKLGMSHTLVNEDKHWVAKPSSEVVKKVKNSLVIDSIVTNAFTPVSRNEQTIDGLDNLILKSGKKSKVQTSGNMKPINTNFKKVFEVSKTNSYYGLHMGIEKLINIFNRKQGKVVRALEGLSEEEKKESSNQGRPLALKKKKSSQIKIFAVKSEELRKLRKASSERGNSKEYTHNIPNSSLTIEVQSHYYL
eukprot:TRINITY_DN13127_c0_g1_i1.p1 TRINITY_DN13127_c0_g1~~TRINITY_DN13127_c0_g1_i1.p1  ORF type:complete len:232 (-),score=42.44 TRINITY_DN13127_c0_g1_i1:161-856(-)